MMSIFHWICDLQTSQFSGTERCGDGGKTFEGGDRTRASRSAYRNAAQLLEIELVTGTQASMKSRGVRLLEERPLYIDDDAIVIGIKTE
jgi:hypothetical protein